MRATMKLRRLLPTIALSAALAFTVGAAGARAFPNPLSLFGHRQKEAQATPAAPPRPAAPGPATACGPAAPASFADIAAAAQPAVVNISTTQTVKTMQQGPAMPQSPFGGHGQQDPFEQFFRHFFGQQMPRDFTQRSLGSGVIIDPGGYIATNAHVVKDAEKIVVKLQDEREFNAKVIGIDEKTDIALVKIDSPGDLKAAQLGDSDALRIGDWVIAIGNPFGLTETVTAGIVSAKGRVIGGGPYDDFIQTDASINPGNSGGPLLNLQSQVVGINSAIYSQSGGNIGIGFAIPINMVKDIVQQLREHGTVVRGWLGVSIQDVTPDLAQTFGLEKAEGALVAEVTPDSPAADAGFKAGDLVLEFNGMPVEHAHQLPAMVASTAIGKKVPVTVLRNGSKKTLTVKVGKMPASEAAAKSEVSPSNWGLTVENITPALQNRFSLEDRNGVIVTAVEPNSSAEEGGMQPGDVITQVNRKSVNDVDDYRTAVTSAGKSSTLLLLVQRQGHSVFIALRRSS